MSHNNALNSDCIGRCVSSAAGQADVGRCADLTDTTNGTSSRDPVRDAHPTRSVVGRVPRTTSAAVGVNADLPPLWVGLQADIPACVQGL
jgi:hypothetical protein